MFYSVVAKIDDNIDMGFNDTMANVLFLKGLYKLFELYNIDDLLSNDLPTYDELLEQFCLQVNECFDYVKKEELEKITNAILKILYLGLNRIDIDFN